MVFGTTKLELRVGIFTFIGIIILVCSILWVGNFQSWQKGYTVITRFSFVDGVNKGAPVRFAGVYIGEVRSLKFASVPPDNMIKVDIECWIRNEMKIPADSTPVINTMGLLGEKYVEIMPGKDTSVFWSDRQIISGSDPLPMHELSQAARKLLYKVDQGLDRVVQGEGTVGKLLYDDALYMDFRSFVADTKKEVVELFDGFDVLLKEIQQNPWKLLFKPKESKKK